MSRSALSIEDLFTLGSFEQAYKLAEDEILGLLAARSLPRQLLLPRPSASDLSASSNQAKLRTSHSTPSDTKNTKQGLNSALSTSTTAKRSTASSDDSGNDFLKPSHHHSSNTSYPNVSDFPNTRSSDVASSSSIPLPTKPKEICFNNLSPPDQEKLLALVFEAMPTLVIMVQCLFELNEQKQIVPFVQTLCGSKYEEYPFELAYLLVNLFVTTKDYPTARTACEAVLSSIKSRLGPLPLSPQTDPLDSSGSFVEPSTSSTEETSPSRDRRSSADFSRDATSSSLYRDHVQLEDVADEDEETRALRENFLSIMHLYIFFILCPLRLFADAKSQLFLESRLHPFLIQEWVCSVDEAEGALLEADNREEEAKRAAIILAQSQEVASPNSSVIGTHKTPKHSSNEKGPLAGLWSVLFEDDDEDALPTHSQQGVVASPSDALQLKKPNGVKRILRKFVKVYRFLLTRYSQLSPSFKLAFAAFAFLATYIASVAAYKWYQSSSLSRWIMERFNAIRAALGGRELASRTASSASHRRIPSTTARFPSASSSSQMLQGPGYNSRTVMGSGMVRSTWN